MIEAVKRARKLSPSEIQAMGAGKAILCPAQTLLVKLASRPVPPLSPEEIDAFEKIVPASIWDRIGRTMRGLFGVKRKIAFRGFERIVVRKGRRSGGTIHVGAPLCVFNALADWDGVLAPGEQVRVLVIAPQLDLCRTALNACAGLLDVLQIPYIRREGEIDLSPAGLRSIIRAEVPDVVGPGVSTTVAFVLWDECFKGNGTDPDSAHPDREVLAATLPTLITTRRIAKTIGMLAIGSPTTPIGCWHDEVEKNLGKLDGRVFACVVPSFIANPLLDEKNCREDAGSETIFAREYLAIPADGEESFLSRGVVQACVATGVVLRRPERSTEYVVAIDAAFRTDRFVCMVFHREINLGASNEQRDVVVVDRIEVWTPKTGAPLDFEKTMIDVANIAHEYNGALIVRDAYAGDAIGATLTRLGCRSEEQSMAPSAQSQRFEDLARRFKSQLIQIVDDQDLVNEIVALRVKLHSSGRASYQARNGAHDDRVDSLALGAWAAKTLRPGGNSAVSTRTITDISLSSGRCAIGVEWGIDEIDPLTKERVWKPVTPPFGTPQRRALVYNLTVSGRSAPWFTTEDKAIAERDLREGLPGEIRDLPDMSDYKSDAEIWAENRKREALYIQEHASIGPSR